MKYIGFKQSKLNVDRETLSITDINVIQEGDIKDWRPFTINTDFLDSLVAFANKQKEGILCNYGHNYNNLGKRLGRLKNFRVSGKKVIADLSIFKAADSTPGAENMGTYVMDLSTEDDKAIMFSISFNAEYYYQLNKGVEHKIWYYDDDDNWVSSNSKYGKIYPKFAELRSVDVVDEGAATDSFFNSDSLDIMFNDMMNTEEFPAYLEENYEKFTILNEFYNKKTKKSFLEQTREFLGMSSKSEDQTKELETLQAQLQAKTAEAVSLQAKLTETETSYNIAKSTITQLESDIQTKDERITELEAMDSTQQPGGGGGDHGDQTDLSKMDSITKKAHLEFQKKQARKGQ